MITTTTFTAPDLYTWQQEALSAWRANGRKGIVEAVTGAGKSRLGLAAIHETHEHGGQSVVLVPSVALQTQWTTQIRDLLPHLAIGRWGDGHSDRLADCDVVVAVVNSAVKHRTELRAAGLIVADECHRYGSRGHRRALAAVPRRLGLTATLERGDEGVARVLRPYFGSTVYRLDYRQALADGVLAPFTVDLVGVDFAGTAARHDYDRLTAQMDSARDALVSGHGYPGYGSGFLERVMCRGADWQSDEGRLCSQYSKAFTARRTVDLPDADLGIIVSASRTKRQMIERMGRIVRPKSDGRTARLVVLCSTDTFKVARTGALDGAQRVLAGLGGNSSAEAAVAHLRAANRSWAGSDIGPSLHHEKLRLMQGGLSSQEAM